ncbi:hypothetical protein RJ641_017021 [Dillenia turbinata]|uniref:F-box domain-containing protein n=1 Tax=Dillenia turbinata TaxID=194707 RepID=A0AAN8UZG0_9MAGN
MHISSPSPPDSDPNPKPPRTLILENHSSVSDLTLLLSDELLLSILSKLPVSQHFTNSLVCKRWLKLMGHLVCSLKLLDWDFLESGRLISRFPNLDSVDLIHAWLRVVALNCPNLRKLGVVAGSESGLDFVAKDCLTLQELELHFCNDQTLRGIKGFRNLQIVKLVGSIDGFYDSVVSDIGLTILAQGCSRLVKLELCGCEGSYDGIKAIGQCCQMLEELSLCDHRMDGGWSFCGNLRTLRLQSFKSIDPSPGPDEHLGSCPTLEELHLQHCQMRNKQSVLRTVRDWKMIYFTLQDNEVTPTLATLFCNLKELKWRSDSRSLLSSVLAETGVEESMLLLEVVLATGSDVCALSSVML